MIFTVIAAIMTMIVILISNFRFEAAIGAHVREFPAPAGSVNQYDWTLAPHYSGKKKGSFYIAIRNPPHPRKV